MDNGSITANCSAYLNWAYENLKYIFEPYKFFLQQFATNESSLQSKIDSGNDDATPTEVKLFGIKWNREADSISTRPLQLDQGAQTKRQVMSSIASNYDLFQFNGPILNKARLFAHRLQCTKTLNWDDKLSEDNLREWRNISRQVNSSPIIKIERFVGRRDSEYRLIAFTDASEMIYGIVIFIQEVQTNKVSFLMARNRMVNKQLETKSVPSLEFQAIALGVETLMDLYMELSGNTCVDPIKIVRLILFSDSMVSLNWISSYIIKLDKMQKRSAFILNRLNHIYKLCEKHPITFNYIPGIENPADCITRSLSYKQLLQSNYLTGPKFLSKEETLFDTLQNDFSFTVPVTSEGSASHYSNLMSDLTQPSTPDMSRPQSLPILFDRYSSFHRLASVYRLVLKFVSKLKLKIKQKKSECDNLILKDNFYEEACYQIILNDQKLNFPDIFSFFEVNTRVKKDIPILVSQLNLFQDERGILRVKSQFDKWADHSKYKFPILLCKTSKITELIIFDLHIRFSHAGCYSVLSEFRKQFYVPHHFSVVKRILRQCIICKRHNQRSIKLNQSAYRDFRVNPPNIPYKYTFIDHMGPFLIEFNGKRQKVWVLCFTCLWSRAVNLKIC